MTGEVDGVFEDEVEDDKTDVDAKDADTEDKLSPDDSAKAEDSEDETTGDEETATPADEKPKSVPIAALHDERRKRKLAEDENESLRRQIPQGEDTAEPDRFDEPEAHDEWMRNKWQSKQDADSQAAFIASVEDSRSAALAAHDDFLEIEDVFYGLANRDESLKREMFDSKDPATFAYEKGKEHLASQREKLRDELIAEGYTKADADEVSDAVITSETKETPKKKVPSLATATAAASNSTQVEKEEDINDMFGDQAY